jgi:hypothetical protein
LVELTSAQRSAVESVGSTFILGPAGAGKSTALQQRLLHLLGSREPAYTVLVLIAEPEHERDYLEAVQRSGLGPYSELQITTYQALAREMVTLFWPLVARKAGFERPYQPPTFLTYDLAQLLMWRTITPLLEEGAFADLRLRPQQIVSQILDTLNRAALNRLTLEEATARQIGTWSGEPERLRHFQDAGTAASTFRRFCLGNNLLDLSLTVQTFDGQLVQHAEFHRYFSERFRYLIVDNVEEQTPAGQNFIASLMDATVTTAIAYDAGGGYKRFLAADPAGANRFADLCQHHVVLGDSHISNPALLHLSNAVENYLTATHYPIAGAGEALQNVVEGRYRRDMILRLADVLAASLDGGLLPKDIAIIAPYLDGALRHSLAKALEANGIPYFLLRRRSSPRDEPRIRAWLTWLALAHPGWGIRPVEYDVAEALSLSISGLDPARAQLAAERLYVPDTAELLPVSELPQTIVERVGMKQVTLVEDLRLWLAANGQDRMPLDIFLHRLFNDLLARRAYQPQPDLAGAAVCDWLVRSAGRLRRAADPMGLDSPAEVGRALIEGIYQGLVTADPPELGNPPDPNGVMISTIYGYLLAGRPVHVQVWLEAAASGWWDIPRQPLSNAFVLTQSWRPERKWTDEDDYKIRNQLLSRIVRGLTSRCTDAIILANSDLDRRGIRQQGPLWRALQTVRTRQEQDTNP